MQQVFRPLIGIPTAELPGTHVDEPALWAMRKSYIEPIVQSGGVPVLLPQITAIEEIDLLLGSLSGLFLAGGHDIHPQLYGELPSSELEAVDEARDRSEMLIVRWAIARDMPIFGVCRGMQILNLVHGGTLLQDIASSLGQSALLHRSGPNDYQNLKTHGHPIHIQLGSRLHQVIGEEISWMNSMHHQAIRRLGEDLRVVAEAEDGVIEAVEASHPERWLVGVQGHPEVLYQERDWVPRLYKEFIQAACVYQRQRLRG